MKKKFHKTAITAGIATLAVGSLLSYKLLFAKTSYLVTRVIDGDTFETAQKQRIRIDGIQAPEKGLCGDKEAEIVLSKLVLNKKVFLKVRYLDAYRRMVSEVYDKNGNLIAEKLAEKGVVIVNQKGKTNPKLLQSAVNARNIGIGLYGLPCTQQTNQEKPSCTIKGNIRFGGDEKLYHRIDCGEYKNTKVQLYLGDSWFCSEDEAQKAGFKKGGDCK